MSVSVTIKVDTRNALISTYETKLSIIYSVNGRITVGFYEPIKNETLTGGVKCKVYSTIFAVSGRGAAEVLSKKLTSF